MPKTPTQRLAEIAEIIEVVKLRCEASEGFIAISRKVTSYEMERIYKLAKGGD